MFNPFMKLTTLGAAVCLALGTASATAQQNQQAQQQDQQMQTRAQSAAAGERNISELRSGYSVERLLDTDVIGAGGESVGSVEDILVRNGRVTAVVIETGGFLDMGDTHFRIPWEQVRIGANLEHVQVPLTEETLDRYSDLRPEKVATGPREWRVSELVGDYTELADGTTYGVVNDLVITRSGEVKGAVVTRNRAFGGGYYAFPWEAGTFDPVLDTLRLPYGAEQVANLRPFDYASFGVTAPRTMSERGTLVTQAQLRNGLSVERLLNMDVRGRNNNSIGEIDNMLVNADGEITAIVVDSGGFLDIGETHFRVPWQQVRIAPGMEYASVPVAEDNIQNFNLFDEGVRKGPREWRVTELLDDYAGLNDGVHYGVVQDLVINRDGKIQAVVVGSRSTFGANYHAFPFRAQAFDPALDTYTLPYNRNQVAGLTPFRYDAYAISGPDFATGQAGRQATGPVGATR